MSDEMNDEMREPLVIPLTVDQQRLFRAVDTQRAALSAQWNAYATAIVAGVTDPATLGAYDVGLTDDRTAIHGVPKAVAGGAV
jgi:hypothetical protein